MRQKHARGVGEWAEKSENCIDGCSHNCRYCYARAMAARVKRIDPAGWKEEKPREFKGAMRKNDSRVMFPSSHDITPAMLDHCVEKLRVLLESGSSVLIVSKPHMKCIARICNEFADYKHKIELRFTIGSASDETLNFWEPGAPSFNQRLRALKLAHKKGFLCSVSCEPMLDDQVDRVIKEIRPYVGGHIWLGKANQLRARLALNKEDDKKILDRADWLIEQQSDTKILALYDRYKNDPMIKYKDGIKKVVGLGSGGIGADR